MKKFKIWLCIALSAILAFGVLAPVFAENDAAEPASTEIRDVFSAELFSNAGVNEFLQLYPQICGALEGSLSAVTKQPITVSSTEASVQAALAVYANGAQGTDSLEEVLHTFGINVFPHSLADCLSAKYPAAADALRTGENDWDTFLNAEGELDVVLDWGLDAIADPAARYGAFVEVIGTLIDAARPVFNAVLGTAPAVLTFTGSDGSNLYAAEVTDGTFIVELSANSMTMSLKGVQANNIKGEIRIGAVDMYQNVTVPVYRSLGIGTVFAYSFPELDPADSALTMAHAVYDPLCALVTKVQADPDVCRSLIRFYRGEDYAFLVGRIGKNWEGDFPVSCTLNGMVLSGGSGVLTWGWTDVISGALIDGFNDCSDQTLPGYWNAGIWKEKLNARLSSLTFPMPASTEIRDVFSADLFSNAEVNRFLLVFPLFCEELENTIAYQFNSNVLIDQEVSDNITIRGRISGYFNGENGTNMLGEVLYACGANVYPRSLGEYLNNNGYYHVGNLLSAKGYSWNAFKNADGELVLDFDWGLDDIADPAERYTAFTKVIGTLIGAAQPLFRAALGTVDWMFSSNGRYTDRQSLFSFEITDGELKLNILSGTSMSLDGTALNNVECTMRFGALDFYQKALIPLYRALGVGTVIDYNFPALNASGSPVTIAHTLYDPLYALMTQVQADADVCRSLIAFYQSEDGAAAAAGIGSELTGDYILSCEINDLDISGGGDAVDRLVQWDWVTDLLIDRLQQDVGFSLQIPVADKFLSCQTLTMNLAVQLPQLTFTETATPTDPEQPTEPTEPATEPTEPATDPTEPATDPTEPATEPTEPATDPTEPATEPTEPATEPTEPATEPTEPATEPTEPATEPTTEPEEDSSSPLHGIFTSLRNFIRKIIAWLRHILGIS